MTKNTTQIENSKFCPILKITSLVQDKINHMCKLFPTKEWSGVLFYKSTGSFKKETLTLTTVDILVLDVGTGTATEYPNHPEIAYFMAENGYEKLHRGLIHSHNTMNTFFSGTDINTLEKEGLDNVHFLSLIVNNKGEYTAKITKRLETYVSENSVVHSFRNEAIYSTRSYTKKSVEYVNVNIKYPENNDKFPDILAAYERIKKEEEEKKPKVNTSALNFGSYTDSRTLLRDSTLEWKNERVSCLGMDVTPQKKVAIDNLNVLKILSLNMGLTKEEAKNAEHYANTCGKFYSVFRNEEGLFSGAEMQSFVETFIEALTWQEDGERYYKSLCSIRDEIVRIGESTHKSNDPVFSIFIKSMESMCDFANGFLENDEFENEDEFKE